MSPCADGLTRKRLMRPWLRGGTRRRRVIYWLSWHLLARPGAWMVRQHLKLKGWLK